MTAQQQETSLINMNMFTSMLSHRVLVYGYVIILEILISACGMISMSSPSQESPALETSFLYQKAQRLSNNGQYKEAITVWEQIPPKDPRYYDAQLAIRQARLQIERINAEEADSFESSGQFDLYVEQAEALEREGKIQEALGLYEEARKLEPQNALLHAKIEEIHEILDDAVERHRALGELYWSRGEFEKAKAEWEGLLSKDPSNEFAKQRLEDIEVLTATSDRVFLTRGRSLMQKGLLNQAKTEFQNALKVDAANERTLNYLAKIDAVPFTMYTVKQDDTLSSIAAGFTNKASDYLILADFNQLDPDAHLRIGQELKIPHILHFREALAPETKSVLTEEGETETERSEMIREITPQQEAETEDMLQHVFEQGIKAYNQGEYREAITLFNQVYEAEPENLEAYNYILQAITNLQRGIRAIDPTAEEPPQETQTPQDRETSEIDALMATALSYKEVGDMRKAIVVFEQAVELAPGNQEIVQQLESTRDELKKSITAHLNEGIRLFNQEALEEAIAEWEKVLDLDPNNEQAANYRQQAEKRLKALQPAD